MSDRDKKRAAEREVQIYLDREIGQVVIDGQDVSNAVSSVVVEAAAGKLPSVTLRAAMPQLVVNGKAEVQLTQTTVDALVALGWTMPGCCECARG